MPPSLALRAAVLALLVLPRAALAERLTVSAQPIEDLKAVFATVESVNQAQARVRISGTVERLAVDEGDRVAAGQELAVVRDDKLPLQLAEIDARLGAQQAVRRQAQLELDRARQLHAAGTGTQARLDEARAALDVADGQIAALGAARALIEQQLAEGRVLSPAEGRVLAVPVVAGAVVMPGEPVATIAADAYVLRLRLPERHARFLKPGDAVLVGARGLAEDGEALRQGRIRQVYPRLDDGQVTADAEVAGLGDYFVGERVRVLVGTGRRAAIVIPPAYVVRRAGTDFVTLADGGAVPVQVGGPVPALPGQAGGLEILSGLRPGDVLATGDAP